MAKNKSFLFFYSWADTLSDFSREERCDIYDAVISYAADGSLPSLSPVAQMAFKFIKKDIDEMKSKYDETCEKRREAIKKRWRKTEEKSENSADTKVFNSYNSIQNIEENILYHDHEHNQEQDHEHNQDLLKEKNIKKKRETARRFSPPTPEEVKAYIEEKKIEYVDAEKFCDFYESNGWRVGKNPMKDWRAAVRNWNRDKKEKIESYGTQRNTSDFGQRNITGWRAGSAAAGSSGSQQNSEPDEEDYSSRF